MEESEIDKFLKYIDENSDKILNVNDNKSNDSCPLVSELELDFIVMEIINSKLIEKSPTPNE